MEDIYILYECDEYCTYESRTIMAVSSSGEKIKSIIIDKIKCDDMRYKSKKDELSISEQIAKLNQDWEKDLNLVIGNLRYGFIETWEDGKVYGMIYG